MRTLVILVALFALATSAVGRPQENLGWSTFHNDRFGLSLEYPAHVFVDQRTSEAGDGDLFVTVDQRAKLLVGAFENVEAHTPSSYQRFIARQSYPGLLVDYAPRGRTWSVLSGTQGNTMVYEKVMFTCGGKIITSFALVYPIAERDFYDPIVEGIEDSFRPGVESCGQHAAQ
jgi:hypothetical protein